MTLKCARMSFKLMNAWISTSEQFSARISDIVSGLEQLETDRERRLEPS